MEQWIILSLLASLCFGISSIAFKLSLKNINPFFGVFLLGIGGFIAAIASFIIKKPEISLQPKSIFFGIFGGVLWLTAMIAVTYALANNAKIGKMAPIYNTNTLITVILSILLLKEIPDVNGAIRILVGALFIVAGSVIVSF
ncbi:EamA family transporter [Candidatus Woesearchaeota archaeon]|nr:EamA family transporter [Candidatus Woesearchaeota archaeon]